ncbi:hypothetical protein [Haloferax larsenii]|uniref:Uncharacterized protein n=1 Tax=Haloferax larsenii TaxID=302484 RepID=A0A1H7UT46_HALLR|nr:hypothetical protein [Haloferax larsenii]SEM00133.1 hypothetical protein SAMN04488691_11426 [Haloferax larsenii]
MRRQKKLIKNRRKVLKSIGASATLSVTGTGLASATDRSRFGGSVGGISYDTLTHQPGTSVSGRAKIKSDRLAGSLSIAGFSIDLSELSKSKVPKSSRAKAEYSGRFTKSKFVKDNQPLDIRIREHEDHLAGVLTRPSSKYGKLGFYIRDDRKVNISSSFDALNPDPITKNDSLEFVVPNKGVPTDSGLDRMMEIARSNAGNKGDNR